MASAHRDASLAASLVTPMLRGVVVVMAVAAAAMVLRKGSLQGGERGVLGVLVQVLEDLALVLALHLHLRAPVREAWRIPCARWRGFGCSGAGGSAVRPSPQRPRPAAMGPGHAAGLVAPPSARPGRSGRPALNRPPRPSRHPRM
eukprot:scaffold2751_cov344-Prasinococcus_capsulatus_cf.AAC.2